MSAFVNVKALVLRSVAYKESSRILTVLTDTEGKLTVSAQGAMRKNSRVASVVQPLVLSEMTLSKNRDRYTLTEAHVIEQFAELSLDLSRFALAAYLAEMLEAVSDADSPSAELLSLGLNALHVLASSGKSEAIVKSAFELRLMCLAGYEPMVEDGAVHGGDFERKVDADTAAAVRYIADCDAKKLYKFDMEKPDALARVAEDYVTAQLERRFGALDYYKSVRNK